MREHQACPAILQAPAPGIRPASSQAEANALTTSEFAELRRLLNHELVAVDEELNYSRSRATPVAVDPARARGAFLTDLMNRRAPQTSLVARQRRVSAAFDRIEAATYGRCCQRGCDAWLPFERLKADPAEPLCADCQDGADAHRKPGG